MLLLTCNDIQHLPSSHVWFSTYWTLPEAAGLAEKLWVSPFPPLFTKDQSFCSFEPISFRWDGGRSRAPGSVCVPMAVVTLWEPAEKGGWAGCMLPLRVLWLLTCNVKWFSRRCLLSCSHPVSRTGYYFRSLTHSTNDSGSNFIFIVYLGKIKLPGAKDSHALTQMRIQSVRILRRWIGLGSRSSL